MRFHSTRGARGASLRAALTSGLASDGGLYVPSRIPRACDAWRECNHFAGLGLTILRPYLEKEVPEDQIVSIVREALDFPVPLVRLEGWDDTYVMELFHGPTLSFKDFGARTMARLMSFFTAGAPVTVLVATSGDTGSAVADGFAGCAGLRVALLFPEGQVSSMQAQQLTLQRPGVRAYAVQGTFDDCQAMVKEALASPQGLRLSVANSINVGRLLPQMLYYFWAVIQGGFEEVVFCVPCGNLGNLTGGVLATQAGLPVKAFLAAHNANRAFPQYLQTGTFTSGLSVQTLSNAMDVGSPSNFDRLQHLCPDMRAKVTGYSISDEETLRSIRCVHEETGYIADPHTAVALEAARRHRKATGTGLPHVVLATAHPAKFPETVCRALGQGLAIPPGLQGLASRPKRVEPLAATKAALMEALRIWR